MNLLAIDIGRFTGYKCENESGVFDCQSTGYKSAGMKFVMFRGRLIKLIETHDIELIVYEPPTGAHFSGVRSHANFEGVLIELCKERNIEYMDYPSTTIKKWLTGSGRASKGDVMLAVMDRFGEEPQSLDEADAMAVYYYAKEKLEL